MSNFGIRDNDRYGMFLANSSIGKVLINISILGFGESITIFKENGERLFGIDTLDEDDFVEEDENRILFQCMEVYKPFLGPAIMNEEYGEECRNCECLTCIKNDSAVCNNCSECNGCNGYNKWIMECKDFHECEDPEVVIATILGN